MSLSCLFHVKRVFDNDDDSPTFGEFPRPPAPALIVVVDVELDRSGSMKKLGAAPTKGLLGFIAEQKLLALETGAKVYFSLTTFDDKAETWIDNVPIAQVNPTPAELVKMIKPRGCTLLVDTMYARLCGLPAKVHSIVQSLPREVRDLKPKVTIVCVAITDGKDNCSTLWTDVDLHALITKKRTEGFAILFLAANQDAIDTANKWGIAAGCAQTFGATEAKTRACFKSASAAAARTSSGFAPRFTKRERLSTAPATAPAVAAQHGGGGGGINMLFQQPVQRYGALAARAISCAPPRSPHDGGAAAAAVTPLPAWTAANGGYTASGCYASGFSRLIRAPKRVVQRPQNTYAAYN
jgi:hypothetical protein